MSAPFFVEEDAFWWENQEHRQTWLSDSHLSFLAMQIKDMCLFAFIRRFRNTISIFIWCYQTADKPAFNASKCCSNSGCICIQSVYCTCECQWVSEIPHNKDSLLRPHTVAITYRRTTWSPFRYVSLCIYMCSVGNYYLLYLGLESKDSIGQQVWFSLTPYNFPWSPRQVGAI